jgi:hypothetical protein
MVLVGQLDISSALPVGKIPLYPVDRKLNGYKERSEALKTRKISWPYRESNTHTYIGCNIVVVLIVMGSLDEYQIFFY